MAREAPEEEPIRLNSSSGCTVCNMRVRVYRSNKKGSVIAFCPNCDCDVSHQITYVKP